MLCSTSIPSLLDKLSSLSKLRPLTVALDLLVAAGGVAPAGPAFAMTDAADLAVRAFAPVVFRWESDSDGVTGGVTKGLACPCFGVLGTPSTAFAGPAFVLLVAVASVSFARSIAAFGLQFESDPASDSADRADVLDPTETLAQSALYPALLVATLFCVGGRVAFHASSCSRRLNCSTLAVVVRGFAPLHGPPPRQGLESPETLGGRASPNASPESALISVPKAKRL